MFDPVQSADPAPSQTNAPQRIVILGSTGSIGTQTIDVVQRLGKERAQIIGLAARGSQIPLLAEQARATGAAFVAVTEPAQGVALETALAGPHPPRAGWGPSTLEYLAALPEADTVVVAVAGAAGLRATLAAVRAGKRVCIATKEILVAAGSLVMAEAQKHGATILPIDSEHSAIFQCVQGYPREQVARLWITASGGPFRTWSDTQIAAATPADALNHPIWRMGGKISVDSATLMNKGLEIIEAHHLFGIPLDDIEVVVHPQSVVHSFVEFRDGALLAQFGLPDMRLPIQIALTYPEKVDAGLPRIRPDQLGTLTWEKPDSERFPAIELARTAARRGGAAPAILNAANEAAVAAFLSEQITFPDICQLTAQALDTVPSDNDGTLESILNADAAARSWIQTQVARQTPQPLAGVSF